MAKGEKKKIEKKKTEVPAEEKKGLKTKLKELRGERDAALAGKDKKKVKLARQKMKKVNLKLKRVTVKAEPPKTEEPKNETAAG